MLYNKYGNILMYNILIYSNIFSNSMGRRDKSLSLEARSLMRGKSLMPIKNHQEMLEIRSLSKRTLIVKHVMHLRSFKFDLKEHYCPTFLQRKIPRRGLNTGTRHSGKKFFSIRAEAGTSPPVYCVKQWPIEVR